MSVVCTVGHSTRSQDELLELLRSADVDLLVDVRRYPASRRHPWFDREALRAFLEASGVEYRHEERLGGRRGPPDPESPNAGWRNDGFRAYADHLRRPEPREALERLVREAELRVPAVLCAEAVPWRCHRRIIADHLVAAGIRVRHLLAPDDVREHELNSMARVSPDGDVVYPAEEPDQGELFE